MKHYHGGNIKDALRKYNLREESIIDFSANINFLGPPQVVLKGIRDKLSWMVNYPEPNADSLKGIIADRLGLERDRIIIGNGAVDLIYQLVKVLNPSKALILEPTFSEYELAVRSVGGEVKHLSQTKGDKFKVTISKLKEELAGVELLFICNPNNPTGVLWEKAELIEIMDYAFKQDIFLLIDESFIDFIERTVDYTIIEQVKKYKNLFVLRSLTKFYAIPGLRLGYGVTDKKLVVELEAARDPWSINYFAQLAGELIFKDEGYYDLSRDRIKEERDYLYQELKKIKGLEVYKPTANFIFINLAKTRYNSQQLSELLGRQGILIRDCQSYHGLKKDFIRVAVRNRQDNQLLLKSIKELLMVKEE